MVWDSRSLILYRARTIIYSCHGMMGAKNGLHSSTAWKCIHTACTLCHFFSHLQQKNKFWSGPLFFSLISWIHLLLLSFVVLTLLFLFLKDEIPRRAIQGLVRLKSFFSLYFLSTISFFLFFGGFEVYSTQEGRAKKRPRSVFL